MKSDDNATYFRAIRQAFANNNAAVMVGAGFSRNAEGGDSLATWPMFAQALGEALDPDAEPTSFSTGMVTQLAEQYAQVFSVPALEDLLKQLVPDDKVAPGLLHDQLLKLPWTEIFTTNYDTLLERAAEKILDRAHFTVCCREDIPQSRILGRRRIVKLHGSFPSQRPFIFTEEHYRRYPKDFAPFVNLVRQSLLENVFCLIGFSGDDPNFLHWIGWVRDMLDNHALPIYLFVHTMPRLGQRKLLEARKVIPVVVPTPEGCEESDYRTRYLKLFEILRTPLGPIEEEWGTFSIPELKLTGMENTQDRLQQLVVVLPELVAKRSSYPGWHVAPGKVRRELSRSLRHLGLPLSSIKQLGLEGSPHGIVAFFSYFVWQQSVLLGSIYDDIAEAAALAIRETYDAPLPLMPEALDVLGAMGIKNQKQFREAWKQSCLGVLRWARQELRHDIFYDIKALLENRGSNKILSDEIEHESILFALYLGDVEAARHKLISWKPGATDPYMLVRKGALLAELGEIDIGLTLSMDGIQKLRAAQKVSKQNTMLLSKESWACLVAHNIQTARNFTIRFSPNAPVDADEDSESLEHLGTRLADLARRGLDVRREYEEILAQLNAEAKPTVARNRFQGFDLGTSNVTQRFGLTSELTEKIDAAESWLNLADRVSLVPCIGNVRFSVDAYTQAAWWIQYNNSTRRMLSVVIRTREESVFKPKDDALPIHKTGWLTRYHVARIPSDMAVEICDRAIVQFDHGASPARPWKEAVRTCIFNAELFSRLVIRIAESETIQAFVHRLIALHCTEYFQQQPQLWESYGRALSRCLLSLPSNDRIAMAIELTKIPLVPHLDFDEHLLRNWIKLYRDLPIDETAYSFDIPVLLQAEIASLIKELSAPKNTASELEKLRRPFVWDRLFAFKYFGFINDQSENAVGELIWRNESGWPLLPGFTSIGATFWPAPAGIDIADRFRQFVLQSGIANFSRIAGFETQLMGSRRAWSYPTDDSFLKNWVFSHNQRPWSPAEVAQGLRIVKDWWDEEWNDIEQSAQSSFNLHSVTRVRLYWLDWILHVSSAFTVEQPNALPNEINEWLSDLVIKAQTIGCSMWRFRLLRSYGSGNEGELEALQREMNVALFSTDPEVTRELRDALYTVIKSSELVWARLHLVHDSIFSAIAARRMPALPDCLVIVDLLIKQNDQCLSDARQQLLRTGMKILLLELDYMSRPPGTDIPDEQIPTLRFLAAQLAYLAMSYDVLEENDWVENWISSAKLDPLPELRFLK